MKISIFGASGRTGQQLAEQALMQGHHVTAFVRTLGKLVLVHERLHIVQGDIHDPEAIDQAVMGQEVVLCALGRNPGEPTIALAEGTRNIISAMRKYGVPRILVVSAAGFLGERADFLVGKLLFWYFRRYLKPLFESMRLQYLELQKSDLKWIAVRPVLLDNGPPKGHYRLALEGIPKWGYRINTGDVAAFLLGQLSSDEYIGKSPAIAY
jgi:putative NADH-flavin reductase